MPRTDHQDGEDAFRPRRLCCRSRGSNRSGGTGRVEPMEDPPFRIDAVPDHVGGVRVILVGELDLATASELRGHLASLEGAGVDRIVLDLSGLSFLDSQGLKAILEASRRAPEAGYQLVLVPGPPSVQRIFEITGTRNRLPFAT